MTLEEPPEMQGLEDSSESKRGFRRQHVIILVLIVLVPVWVFAAQKFLSNSSTPRRPPAPIVGVVLPPPLVTPPPPPPLVRPPEQKMVEQPKISEAEEKPDEKPPEQPDPGLGTGITGNGSGDGFGLGRGGGNGLGLGGGTRSNSSKWGWYAGQLQTRIADALRTHPKTRLSRIDGLVVRIWADVTGRVTRVQLGGSSGDPAVDAALRSEILNGLQLREPPPPGMPMPIVLRINSRRPN